MNSFGAYQGYGYQGFGDTNTDLAAMLYPQFAIDPAGSIVAAQLNQLSQADKDAVCKAMAATAAADPDKTMPAKVAAACVAAGSTAANVTSPWLIAGAIGAGVLVLYLVLK